LAGIRKGIQLVNRESSAMTKDFQTKTKNPRFLAKAPQTKTVVSGRQCAGASWSMCQYVVVVVVE